MLVNPNACNIDDCVPVASERGVFLCIQEWREGGREGGAKVSTYSFGKQGEAFTVDQRVSLRQF